MQRNPLASRRLISRRDKNWRRQQRSAKTTPKATMPGAVPLEAETVAMTAAATVTEAEVTVLDRGELPGKVLGRGEMPGKARELVEVLAAESRLAVAVGAVIRMEVDHAVAAIVAVAAAVRQHVAVRQRVVVQSVVNGVGDAAMTVAVVTVVEPVAVIGPEIEAAEGTVAATVMVDVAATVMVDEDVDGSTTAGGDDVAQGRMLTEAQVGRSESGVGVVKGNVTDPIAEVPAVAVVMQSVDGLRTSDQPVARQVAIAPVPIHIVTTRNATGKRMVQPPTAGVSALMKRNLGRSAKTIARSLRRSVSIEAEAAAIAVKR